MKRPLAIVSLFYVGGLIAGAYLQIPLLWLFIATFALLALTIFSPKRKELLLAITLALTGWTNFLTRTEVLSPHDLRRQIGNETQEVSLRGKIIEAPSERRYQRDEKETWRTLARLEVTSIKTSDTWQPSHGKVMLSTFGRLEQIFFNGQTIEVSGVIQRPQKPIAEGLFDYRTFLERQAIYYQLNVSSPATWVSLQEVSPPNRVSKKFLDWAQRTLKQGINEEDESLRLLWAMTLGWKTALTDEVSEPFMRSGTMHIFAISGLHIALIAGILIALLRVLRASRLVCGLVVIPLIWFYTMATGWQPSAIRSTIMMTIVIAGWSLKRPGDLLNSLGAAAFIILLWDPQQLFQASFQLSFFVVLSIALLMPGFDKMKTRLLKHDPFLPNELRPRWQRWLDIPIHWMATLFITSLAAWLGSLPLTALYFHLFTPISLLANLVVVPLSSLALMSNLGSLLCAPICPPLTEIFNASGWFFMKSMVTVSEWFAQTPGAFLHIRAPSLAACLLYYTLLLAILNGWFLVKIKRLFAFLAIGILGSIYLWNWNAERGIWKITILPLAGGEAIHVNAPGKENDLLIDCGSQSSADFVTKPFLQAQGINRLSKLLLTHGDLKNMGSATNIISEFKVSQTLLSPVRFRSPAYRALQEDLKSTSHLNQVIQSGDQVGIWKVLYPKDGDKFPQADDGPVILFGEISGTKILFLSDLSRDGQRLFWERNPDLGADIIVTGLPRDSEPLNDDLINSLHPKLIIITDSEYPAPERASEKLKERLKKHKTSVLYCREAGAITLRFDAKGFAAETAW